MLPSTLPERLLFEFRRKAPIPASIVASTEQNMPMFFRNRALVFFSLMGALVTFDLAHPLKDSFISGTERARRRDGDRPMAYRRAVAVVSRSLQPLVLRASLCPTVGKDRRFGASPASAFILTGEHVPSRGFGLHSVDWMATPEFSMIALVRHGSSFLRPYRGAYSRTVTGMVLIMPGHP